MSLGSCTGLDRKAMHFPAINFSELIYCDYSKPLFTVVSTSTSRKKVNKMQTISILIKFSNFDTFILEAETMDYRQGCLS